MATAKKRAPAKAATVKKSAPGVVVMVGDGRSLVQLTEQGGRREWYANEELKGAGDGD